MQLFTVSERGVEAGIPVVQKPQPQLVVGEPGRESRLLLDKRFRGLPPGHRLLQADLVLSGGRTCLKEPSLQEDRALVALRFVAPYRGTVKYALVLGGKEYHLRYGGWVVVVLATGNVLPREANGMGSTPEHLVALWPGAEIRVRLQSPTVAGYDEDGTAQRGVAEWRYLIRWDGEALLFTDFWEQETRQAFE